MTANRQTSQSSLDLLYDVREKTGDVTFIVESELIKAHRCILAAFSPKYKQDFDENPNRDEIYVPNVSAGAFNVFLELFYKDTVKLTIKNVDAVLDLAIQSSNDKFLDTCFDFIQSKITSQTVFWAYGLALKYGMDSFCTVCERQIQCDPKQAFASDAFLHCDHETLMFVLQADSLGCPETDVFNACIAWARENCKQKKLPGNPKNLRAALGDAIYQIRFSSMDAKEFAALHKSMPRFFTKSEINELKSMAAKVNGFQPKKFSQETRSIFED